MTAALTYWEHRGPRDWRPVVCLTSYGTGPLPPPAFPLVVTRPRPPRNVAIGRTDGHTRVVPVRTLRRERPC